MVPTVSIGMPVHNGERFIREALDSLLAQTFTDFELIISDNASADGTEAICREYAACDSRIRYVRHSENRGWQNHQYVLNEAAGEYFMWTAHDDVWDERWIEMLLPTSSTYQCLAYGHVQIIDGDGKKVIHPANHRKFEFSGNRLVRRMRYYMEPGILGKPNPIYGIYPTKIIREMPISCVAAEKSGGDMIFLYMLLDRMEIRHAGDVYLYKRVHADCHGASEDRGSVRSGYLSRSVALIKAALHGPMLGQYIRRSSWRESIILCVVYPLCVIRILACFCLHYARSASLLPA